MVTLSILLIVIFVPASRRLLARLFFTILGVLGIFSAVTKHSTPRRYF